MEYEKLINIVVNYIECNDSKETAERFCYEFMDTFYTVQNDLEQEVSQDIYEIFDDINLTCDSYEPNEEIREMDKYCIDEITLRNKVVKYYQQILR